MKSAYYYWDSAVDRISRASPTAIVAGVAIMAIGVVGLGLVVGHFCCTEDENRKQEESEVWFYRMRK